MSKAKIIAAWQSECVNQIEFLYSTGARKWVGLGDRGYILAQSQRNFLQNAYVTENKHDTVWTLVKPEIKKIIVYEEIQGYGDRCAIVRDADDIPVSSEIKAWANMTAAEKRFVRYGERKDYNGFIEYTPRATDDERKEA